MPTFGQALPFQLTRHDFGPTARRENSGGRCREHREKILAKQQQQALVNEEQFRQFVRKCAEDSTLITEFNRLMGTQLPDPIVELVNYPRPAELSGLEAFDIAVFVMYLRAELWPKVLNGLARLSSDLRGSSGSTPVQC